MVDEGPLPRGYYVVEIPVTHPMLGPIAMRLTPAPGNNMFTRGGFWIHGPGPEDETKPPSQRSSLGCIVAPATVRAMIRWRSAEGLTVVQ